MPYSDEHEEWLSALNRGRVNLSSAAVNAVAIVSLNGG
jgi:hypothetical protein